MYTLAKFTCSYLVLVGALTQNVASNPVTQPVPFSQRIQNEASCAAVKKTISGLEKSKVIDIVDSLCKQEGSSPCLILLESARMVCNSQGAIGNDAVDTSQSSLIDCSKLETKFNENLSPGMKIQSQFFTNDKRVSDNQSCYTLCLRDHHPICSLIQNFQNAIPAKSAPVPTKKPLLGAIIGSISRIGSGSGVPTVSGAASKRGEAEPSSDKAAATGAPESAPPKLVPGIGQLTGSASGVPARNASSSGSASGSGVPARDVPIASPDAGSVSKQSVEAKSETKKNDATQKPKPSVQEDTKAAASEKAKPATSFVNAAPESDIKLKPNSAGDSTGNVDVPKTRIDITTKQQQSIQNEKEEAFDKPPSDAFGGDGNQDPLEDSAEDTEPGDIRIPYADDSVIKTPMKPEHSKKEDTYSKMPQLQYNDPLAGPDTGYFGHFIMFLAVCAIIFLLLQNKKRIIAMIVEGPKNNGRRRTSSASGSYRKLENNFD